MINRRDALKAMAVAPCICNLTTGGQGLEFLKCSAHVDINGKEEQRSKVDFNYLQGDTLKEKGISLIIEIWGAIDWERFEGLDFDKDKDKVYKLFDTPLMASVYTSPDISCFIETVRNGFEYGDYYLDDNGYRFCGVLKEIGYNAIEGSKFLLYKAPFAKANEIKIITTSGKLIILEVENFIV